MSKRLIALFILPAFSAAAGAQPAKPAAAQPIARTGFISNMDVEFRKMDTNNDGTVGRNEIESFQRVQALAQARINNQRMFAALDADRNNMISPVEYLRLIKNPPPANPQTMLQRFDSNRDGKIVIVEFRAGTLANFDKLDADKDGMVTASEMKAGGFAPR